MLDKVMIAHTEMNKYPWFSHTDRHRYSKIYREGKIDTMVSMSVRNGSSTNLPLKLSISVSVSVIEHVYLNISLTFAKIIVCT